MRWRVLTNTVASDLERLSDAERDAVVQDLLTWVDDGPPRQHPRQVSGAQLFEERLPSGFDVVYAVVEAIRPAATATVVVTTVAYRSRTRPRRCTLQA